MRMYLHCHKYETVEKAEEAFGNYPKTVFERDKVMPLCINYMTGNATDEELVEMIMQYAQSKTKPNPNPPPTVLPAVAETPVANVNTSGSGKGPKKRSLEGNMHFLLYHMQVFNWHMHIFPFTNFQSLSEQKRADSAASAKAEKADIIPGTEEEKPVKKSKGGKSK